MTFFCRINLQEMLFILNQSCLECKKYIFTIFSICITNNFAFGFLKYIKGVGFYKYNQKIKSNNGR